MTAGPCSSKGSRDGSLPTSPSFSVSLGCQHTLPVSAVTQPSSYKDTRLVGSGASTIQDDLILTNDVCKDPVSKYQNPEVLGGHEVAGNTLCPNYRRIAGRSFGAYQARPSHPMSPRAL